MKTILYVEDNAIVVAAYKGVLTRAGFNVDVADDGLVAMKKLAMGQYDLILLDLMMPKINGTDVLKYIRSTPKLKALPVVVLSDGTLADVADTALRLGVQGTLLKSQCTPDELVQLLKKVSGEGAPPAPAAA